MDLELVSLIYRSPKWLRFVAESCRKYAPEYPLRFVANDATDEVIEALEEGGYNWTRYEDPKPDAYYIDRVYRAWNVAVYSSDHEHVCLLNSDMALAENAIQNLVSHAEGDPSALWTSRLVESGKIPSGQHALVRDFGRTPEEFDDEAWQAYAKSESLRETHSGGLFMPVIFEVASFLGFPEGNVRDPTGRGVTSGDKFLFDRYGNHMTAFNSLVYHVQEGEMDA